MAESDTGGHKKTMLEDEKDKRIMALEEEVRRLRERERALMEKLGSKSALNLVNDL